MYKITTNNHVRELVSFNELPKAVQSDFDYVDEEDRFSPRFVRYREDWYDTSDVMIAPDSIKALGWDGFNSDSHWSGMVYRYFDRDGYELDGVVIGYLVSTEES